MAGPNLYKTFGEAVETIAIPYVAGKLGQMPVADLVTDQIAYTAGLSDPVKSRYHYLFKDDNGKFEYIGSSDKLASDIKQLVDLPETPHNKYFTSQQEEGLLAEPQTNNVAQYLGAFDTITAGRFKRYDALANWIQRFVLPGEQLEKHMKYSIKMQLGNSRFYVIDSLHPLHLATNNLYWNWRSLLVNGVDKTGVISKVEDALEGAGLRPYMAFQQLWEFLSDVDHFLTGISAASPETIAPKYPKELTDLESEKVKTAKLGEILNAMQNPPAYLNDYNQRLNWAAARTQELYGP